MSLLTIRNQIITEIGGRTDVNTVIDDQINFAAEEIGTMYPFFELNQTATTTTASGQFEYLLPADLFVLWTVRDATKLKRKLVYKDIQAFDEIDTTLTGQPYNWTQWNKSLLLFNQVPDTNAGSHYSIRIRYWRYVPDLSADGDTHILPARVERGIRLKATAYTLRILNMEEKAGEREQEFDRWVSRMEMPAAGTEKETKSAVAYMRRGNSPRR